MSKYFLIAIFISIILICSFNKPIRNIDYFEGSIIDTINNNLCNDDEISLYKKLGTMEIFQDSTFSKFLTFINIFNKSS